MMTRSAVPYAGPLGITVNAVAPGPVQTGYITPNEVEELEASLALRRVGTPQDLADAIVFLCSRRADWITGQVLKVDGGSGYHLK
jgi:3-oxoacyl-[acyl-carrier protein] reductase